MDISHEEVRILERKIRSSIKEKLQSSAELKRILAQGLATFEKALNALKPEERERALSLYLDRIRGATFEFHMAVLRYGARDDIVDPKSSFAVRERLQRHANEIQEIAQLYELL